MTSLEETQDAGTIDATGETIVYADVAPDGYGAARELDKGQTLGRYMVLRELGAGAMGTVYLAYDPDLDRKLALKLLRGGSGEARRRSMLREAQAMAKLRHPNVVAAHDVGEHDGSVYVAMDFVEGTTLGAWLRAENRTWREILDKLLSAGRGLEAAHASELIHRDFKPENVMVSSKGGVLVTDFGLARTSADTSADTSETEDDVVDAISRSGSVLTEATVGHIAGTPAYMAPEQIRGQSLTPAADQFAFCVTVWEALCGQRPFAGKTLVQLYSNTSAGRIRPKPRGRRMPRWLERVLVRGLASDPAERWPSMTALLDALERGRRRWRWQLGLAGITVFAIVFTVVVMVSRQDEREHEAVVAACKAEGRAIDEIWNDTTRERLRDGLLAIGIDFASDSAETVLPWLDDYRVAWSSGRTEACLHRDVAQDWDADLHERAAWCFEDRRLQFEATVNQILALDRADIHRAVRIVSYLEPVDTCLDRNTVSRLPTPSADLHAEIRSVRAQISEVDKLINAGRYAESVELAATVHTHAKAVAWPPLMAHAGLVEGRGLLFSGQREQALATLMDAYFDAQAAGSTEIAFRASRSLVIVLMGLKRGEDALVWDRHASVLAAGLDDLGGLDAAEGHYLRSSLYTLLGDHESAVSEAQRALAMRTEALGAEHPITAAAMRVLGKAYLDSGRPAEALVQFERADRIWRPVVGRLHPYIVTHAQLRSEALRALGRLDEAIVQAEEALAIQQELLAAEDPRLARSRELVAELREALEAG